MPLNEFSLGDIYLAMQRINAIITRTPLVYSPALSDAAGARVMLKLENLQITGAFKLRGASNKILSLSKDACERGVITASSGNHGKAVAYVAQKTGVQATVCVPKTVPLNKRQAIESLGAVLLVAGEDYDKSMQIADELQLQGGMTMIHAFDDLDVIAGQGTIGLELVEEFPEIDTVIVPMSGGGLISGIAFSLKTIKPNIQVIGVTMEHGAAMVESIKMGKIVEINEQPTLADALAGGLNKDNRYTFPMVQKYVDETVLVSEREIAKAIWFCLEQHRIIIEGGAAVGIAALNSGKIKNQGKNIAVVISGANLSMTALKQIISEEVDQL